MASASLSTTAAYRLSRVAPGHAVPGQRQLRNRRQRRARPRSYSRRQAASPPSADSDNKQRAAARCNGQSGQMPVTPSAAASASGRTTLPRRRGWRNVGRRGECGGTPRADAPAAKSGCHQPACASTKGTRSSSRRCSSTSSASAAKRGSASSWAAVRLLLGAPGAGGGGIVFQPEVGVGVHESQEESGMARIVPRESRRKKPAGIGGANDVGAGCTSVRPTRPPPSVSTRGG